ncbi:PREDICTED: putative mediator of RNA polymerase II transcription subunit 26 [Atta colombica]|uniref:putative mediator of RNA polymerase II transcription subunit 26 n=1 Tax=Atta colombica TaxID=520822 RepID=UPI00084C9509|nr:PREDICTED: putative mediator of RNA polymerase II transcription subunit 26 [Atta colombica]
METTMLLPIAPAVVTKVHDDKDFADANYYHQFFCKQLRDQEQELQELLETLERRRKQQQQQQQQQQQLYQQLQLLLTPNDYNRNDYRNNVLHQERSQQTRSTTNTIEERRTRNQLQSQVQPKPEPKFEPEPEPEPQLNPQPKEAPTPNQVLDLEEYDSKPVSLFDLLKNIKLDDIKLILQLGNLIGKFELDEPKLSQLYQNQKPIDFDSLPISKSAYSLYEENCSQKNELFNLEDSNSESKTLPLPQKTIDFEDQQFKSYSAARKIKLLKRQVFMNRRSPYVILRPIKRSRDFIEVYHASLSTIRTKIKNSKNFQCSSPIPSKFSEADSPMSSKSSEANSPIPLNSASSEADSSVPSNSSEADNPIPSKSSETDNCLSYMSDEEDDYLTRCKNKASKAFKMTEEEYLKEWHSWKQSDSFQIDFSEDEETDSRIAIKEEQQVSFQHQLNMSQMMAQFSVRMSPSLLKPLSSRASYTSSGASYTSSGASYTSSEVSSSLSEASTSSLETLPSPMAIKNPLNEDNQRITRKKHEEIQQQMAYNIKKSTLIDHCYHQTNVSETLQVFKEELETEESEDEEAIIDVVSVKTGKKQLSFAKQVAHFDLESQRKEKYEDSDEDEPPVSRRPRGRPPGSSKRRANRSGPAPKRARIQNNVHSAHQQPEQSFSTSFQYQNSMRQCALQRDSFEDTERRRLHNNMERQRRINMKESYEQLRMQVPAVAGNDRASKVSILKQGATFIKSLTEIGNSLKINITNLRQQNEMLKRKLQQHKQIFNNTVGKFSSFS